MTRVLWLTFLALIAPISAQQPAPPAVAWEALLTQPAAWYGLPEATRIADNLLLYQRGTGGWPKNADMTAVLTPADRARLIAQQAETDSTIDNGATTTEIETLARVFAATNLPRFKDGALAGLDYLLRAQYPNGGWPQYFPLRDDYSRHITFNDDAVARVLTVLREAADGQAPYGFVDADRRARIRAATDRGLEIILDTQIRVNGQLTVWCAQHDAVTLAPALARTYELPSFSGSESVKIVRYLMSLPDPSPRVVAAVDAAVAWLRAHALSGIRVERRPDPATPRGYDLFVVEDPDAPLLWARFYDLETAQPIFVGRDGIKREQLSDIEYERRTGYSYLGAYATSLLETDYPAWRAARRAASATGADDPMTIDHYVRVRSAVPSMAGQTSQLYVRERALTSTVLRGSPAADRVVLFVHGAGTPAEVAFDVPYQDYSWMAYLARAGFDVFAMDLTGHGRSTRPLAMNDPCNLSAAQQAQFVPALLAAPCTASYPQQLTTIASDWHDIGAVVEYIRALRQVDRVSLIGWSLGGPRAGGFAAQHPDKVHKLVLLSPAYAPGSSDTPPATLPATGAAFNTQSRADFVANWDRQVGCADQVDPAARDSVWSTMVDSDPVGATWGGGVRRAPQVTTWGWNAAMAARVQAPALLVAAVHDVQVRPAGVQRLFADLGSPQKVLVDLGCSSHNALWERQHTMLFRASREWLEQTAVGGTADGVVKLGY